MMPPGFESFGMSEERHMIPAKGLVRRLQLVERWEDKLASTWCLSFLGQPHSLCHQA